MEPDMVVDMHKSTKEKKAVVKTLIGDDDTTAFNRARQEVCPTMEKVSDKNHVKKNISSQLYNLKPKYKELSVKTINAIMKGFSYMLSQAKGDKDYVKEGLQSVVLHQFGSAVIVELGVLFQKIQLRSIKICLGEKILLTMI